MTISAKDRIVIEEWCKAQTPVEAKSFMRLEPRFRGLSVNIFELAPPWQQSTPDWIERRVAKMTVDPDTDHWLLFAMDRNDHLLHYSRNVGVGLTLRSVLGEIERDPTFIFWG